nr:uncharacterized protein LOC111414998 isoform X1 [Onthophagus taurus]
MASVGFRWLDILEKEFDKAFVDLDLAIGDLDPEEPDIVYNVRQKLCTLSSCFAQLTHKAQTIFQNSAKIEAELIHMRAELVESKSKREILEQELHNLLLQLHTAQLTQLPALNNGHYKQEPDVDNIKKKIEDELKKSPSHSVKKSIETEELKFSPTTVEITQLKTENAQLQNENSSLRNSMLALNSEVYGAKLAAKYLDKELAGRIQQLQLLGREMRGDVRDKLWRQLESEILLQRHKTVVRECRRNSVMSNADKMSKPQAPIITENGENFGDIRTVVVKRKPGQGLGISITGGREHGVPILISELEENGPAAISGQLYIGDAILCVNDRDLRQACHREAVDILKQPSEECRLQVQYIAADDSDNSLEEDGYNFHYRFFDREVCSPNDSISLHPLSSSGVIKTPTAPRTPDSTSQSGIRHVIGFDTPDTTKLYNETFIIDQVIDTLQAVDIKNSNDLIALDTEVSNTKVTTEENTTQKDLTLLSENLDLKKLPNLNCSTNSLNSENLSSPMQTSTDMFVDSEVLSTDSQSPKTADKPAKAEVSKYDYKKKTVYDSNETFSLTKSDQSLLNSAESDDSSPVHKAPRDYKKVQRRYKTKKYFGVKTLQSIFGKHNGYSDVSSTASDFGDDLNQNKPESCYKEIGTDSENANLIDISSHENNNLSNSVETTPQFEENIHSILSEMFRRNFDLQKIDATTTTQSKTTKKSLRVGKALRLCPNDEFSYGNVYNDQKREKLLARYVYNANCLNADGVGDPDFGTPV